MRRAGFSPALSLLIPAFSLACAPTFLTVRLHRCMRRSSTAWELESGCSRYCPLSVVRCQLHCNGPRTTDNFNLKHPVSSSQTRCFGTLLIPDHLRRYSTRPVSYYALFKWWLLLSQHPGCLCRITSYRTKQSLGTLAGGLGCFPLDREDYPSRTHSRDSLYGIRSLVGACRRVAPRLLSVALPP